MTKIASQVPHHGPRRLGCAGRPLRALGSSERSASPVSSDPVGSKSPPPHHALPQGLGVAGTLVDAAMSKDAEMVSNFLNGGSPGQLLFYGQVRSWVWSWV